MQEKNLTFGGHYGYLLPGLAYRERLMTWCKERPCSYLIHKYNEDKQENECFISYEDDTDPTKHFDGVRSHIKEELETRFPDSWTIRKPTWF